MKQFSNAKLIASNVCIETMAWSCAPNKSVWVAQEFCKAS